MHGWATVQEYEEDELADNSDDEKRLFRAETRAGKKLKQKNFKNAKKKSQQWGGFVRASWWGPALHGWRTCPQQCVCSGWHQFAAVASSKKILHRVLVVQAHPSWVHATCVVKWDIIGGRAHCCWELTPPRAFNN